MIRALSGHEFRRGTPRIVYIAGVALPTYVGRQLKERRRSTRDAVTDADNSPVPEYERLLRVDGRRFLVLGAGQGIGRQVAHALARNGARVACVDRDESLAIVVSREVGGEALCADVTSRSEMTRVFDDLTAGGPPLAGVIDIVGIAEWGRLLDIEDSLWDRQMDACLRHAYLAVQLGGRAMAATGGVMVFVTSASGTHAAPSHGAYGAAKAALISLMQTAAVELGPLGIRVNGVAPGATMTPRVTRIASREWVAQREQQTPLRRLNAPSDIAATVLFLASDLSRNVNGQNLQVDCGMSVLDPWGDPQEVSR